MSKIEVWIARDEGGSLTIFPEPPKLSDGTWFPSGEGLYEDIREDLFPEIKEQECYRFEGEFQK